MLHNEIEIIYVIHDKMIDNMKETDITWIFLYFDSSILYEKNNKFVNNSELDKVKLSIIILDCT